MNAGVQIIQLLLHTLVGLFLVAVILRFLLQLFRADFYNPVSQFVIKVTNPALKPMRKIMPGLGGIDVASIVLATALQALVIFLQLLILGLTPGNPLLLIVWGLLGVLALLVDLYFFAILAMIILSWFAPGSYHPFVILLHQLTEPVMAPFRRLLPPFGGLDLSPILVIMLLKVVDILITSLAQGFGMPLKLAINL